MDGTDEGQGQEQDGKIELSPEVQKFVDKLVGNARVKARELAKAEFEKAAGDATADAERKELAASAEFEKLAQMHASRVTELEPFEAEAKAYRELIAGLLKDRIKVLGKAAETAVKALPTGMSDLEKLTWLDAMAEEWFEAEGSAGRVGTPARKKKAQPAEKKEVPGRRESKFYA